MEIVWDFARQLDTGVTPGNTTSYFDEMCQSFYTDSGTIRTQVGELNFGQWENLTRDPEQIISDSGYSILDIEHHYNGHVWGTAQHNADVVLLLYAYMMDVTNWLKSGEQQLQADNQIKTGRVTLLNVDKSQFEDNVFTLFAPGNRIIMNFMSGDSDQFEMGQYFIEDSPYAEATADFTFSGRNRFGFSLSNQSYDERTTYTGTLTDIFTQMLLDAGVESRYILVETTASTGSFTFNESDKYINGIPDALAIADWYADDKPDGTIVVGSSEFVRTNVASTGIYSFSRGSEIFTRSLNRKIDGLYSRVCVRRNGTNPRKVYADVPHYDGWYISGHRTFYQNVPDATSDTDMDRISTQLVDGMQYSGVVEQFDGPIRPWLQIGDVAYVTGGDSPRVAGIITNIQHSFGDSGYFTSFSVTSGGTISNPDNPETVMSQYVGRMGGANRQRRLLDYIKGGTTTGSTSGSSAVGAVAYQAAVAGGYTGDEQSFNEHIAKIAAGAYLPAGGSKDMILAKTANTDYTVAWVLKDTDIWGGM